MARGEAPRGAPGGGGALGSPVPAACLLTAAALFVVFVMDKPRSPPARAAPAASTTTSAAPPPGAPEGVSAQWSPAPPPRPAPAPAGSAPSPPPPSTPAPSPPPPSPPPPSTPPTSAAPPSAAPPSSTPPSAPAPAGLPPQGSPVGSFVDVHGLLSVQGGRVLDQYGQPLRLTGMSLFWSQWMGQFWNDDVVRWLRDDWHCNVVRAAMGVETGGYLEDADAQKQKVVTVVEAAIAAGIYVIIDWHEENADQHATEAKAFFSEMAQRYGTYPNVLFETFNEPTEQSWSDQIKPYHEQIVSAIREHSRNLAILGTGLWSQRVDEAADDPVSGENIAYTLHFYSATHGQDLRDKAQQALDKGVALFVTEWGASSADGDGVLDLDAARAWLSFLEESGISCVNWSVCDKDEKSASLKPGASHSGGWADGDLSESGVFVRDALRSYWDPASEAVVLK